MSIETIANVIVVVLGLIGVAVMSYGGAWLGQYLADKHNRSGK